MKWTETNWDIKTYHNYEQTFNDTLQPLLDITHALGLPELSYHVNSAMNELLNIDSHIDNEVFKLVFNFGVSADVVSSSTFPLLLSIDV